MPASPMNAYDKRGYFQFKKTITNKEQLDMLKILEKDWGLSPSEVCYQLLREGLIRERKKRSEVESLRQG